MRLLGLSEGMEGDSQVRFREMIVSTGEQKGRNSGRKYGVDWAYVLKSIKGLRV